MMIKQLPNYYSVLAVNLFESNQDTIKYAYKKATAKYHPKTYVGDDIKQRLIEVNEAYLVLSDNYTKMLYDATLTLDTEISEDLSKLIGEKHQKAESFINSYFSGIQKKKNDVTACAIGCGIFLFFALGSMVKTCLRAVNEEESVSIVEVDPFIAPTSWNTYKIKNSFCLSVPPTLELRSDYDKYTRFLKEHDYFVSNAEVVFQQKDLSDMSNDAMDTYCRILVNRDYLGDGEANHYYESPMLTSEDYETLKDIADAEVVQWVYSVPPAYSWIDINGTKAIDISYIRDGVHGDVVCHIYLLFNYDELVKIVTAYRKSDESIWEYSVSQIIKSFKWDKLK
jgi:hypothetical protein